MLKLWSVPYYSKNANLSGLQNRIRDILVVFNRTDDLDASLNYIIEKINDKYGVHQVMMGGEVFNIFVLFNNIHADPLLMC
jgi:hypothetical protein